MKLEALEGNSTYYK